MAPWRASTTKSEWLPDDPTAFAPIKLWKLPFITTWDDSRNQNHPTDSAEEAIFYARYADEHVGTGNQGPGPVGRRRHFGRSGHRRKCRVGASDHEGRCASELC